MTTPHLISALVVSAACAASLALAGCDDGGDDALDSRPVDARAPVDGPRLDLGADGAPTDLDPTDGGIADGEAADAEPSCTADGEPAFESHAVGRWTVDVDPASGAWQIVRPEDGAVILRSPARCVAGVRRPMGRIGRGTPGLQSAFGAFRVELDGPRSRLEWHAVPSAAPAAVEGDANGVTLRSEAVDGTAIALRFARDGAGLRVELEADADAAGFGWRCTAESGFFGLGTQVIGLDLRGRRYPLFTQEQGIGKPEGGQPFPLANIPEAAYAPMGVWHASDGYSAVITHDGYSDIDLCAADPERVELESFGAMPGFVLLPGRDLRERMQALGDYVGRPPDVPPWVFAPWNDAVGGPERLATVAESLRREGIPSSAIWSEDWIGGEQTGTGFRLSYAWEWDPTVYPDLIEEIAALHRRGYAFLAYFNPFVPEPTRMFSEGTDGGWLVEDDAGEVITFRDPAFRNAALVDLTDAGALDWLRAYQITAARELGIDGWMADFAEWLPVEARMADGSDGWGFHNRYPLAWQQANVDAMREAHADAPDPDDWTFFVRSGWASVNGGTAGIAPALWAGDQNTDWSREDGFPTVLPIGVHVGLAGVAVYGSDIAGYTSEFAPNTTKELFYRWAAVGAFHPLMRTHHGSDECGNWAFDRDADTVAHYRRYATVHTLLYPYLRARMDEAVALGWPIVRHPYFSAPSHPGLWQAGRDLYFLGDDLLIAPVVEQGADARAVHLPGDDWWPLFAMASLPVGEPGPGRTVVHTVDAPPTEIPVFVRPGAILPLLPRAVDSFYGAEDAAVSDLDGLEGALRLALYPTADGMLDALDVDEAVVSGMGWQGVPDWDRATLDGMPLDPCDDPPVDPCVAADGIYLPALRDGIVRVGDAELSLTGAEPRDWWVSFAGEAWGEWAAPTPLGDLNPDIPPPCEE